MNILKPLFLVAVTGAAMLSLTSCVTKGGKSCCGKAAACCKAGAACCAR